MSEGMWQDQPEREFTVPEPDLSDTDKNIKAAQRYLESKLGGRMPADAIERLARAYERDLMNDAHDNAADDRTMLANINTRVAVEAFRATEQKRFQLEIKEHALGKTLNGSIDMDVYVRETEEIRAQFEQKRQEYKAKGLLPRD